MAIILGGFVKPRRLGRLVGSDVGVRLERDPNTVREPDLAFISAENRTLDVRNTGYIEVAPDLVVEIRTDAPDVMLREDDTLDGGLALPSFSCAVRDMFDL